MKPVSLTDRKRLELTLIVLSAIERIRNQREARRFVREIMER